MRFREFNIIKEATTSNVVVIGDSIANGIAGAGGVSKDLTDPGKNTSFILQNLVGPFVQSGKAKGATVILSSGAANSGNVITVDGEKFQNENLGPVSAQLKQLKDAGAKVMLVGVASTKTPPQKPTKHTQGKNWIVDYTGMNDRLASIASANGATFLGPLEEFDPNISKGDGIHPFNGYSKLFKAGSAGASNVIGNADATPGAPTTKDKVSAQDAVMRAFKSDGSFYVPMLVGNKGPEIADLQKALVALGYQLPKYGIDGIIGKETKDAIKAFQADQQLTTDGIAGKDTIAAVNKAITSNPKVAGGLRKSTQADVKTRVQNVAQGDAKGGAGATGSATTALKFFTNKGWTPEQAAGIVGNLQAESGANLQVDIVGDNGQAYGIAQWHPPRQATFRKTIGKDIVGSSLQDQLAFVDWELNNTESNAGRQLKTAKTAEEAAWIMDEYYERSSGAHRQKRINNAVALLPQSTTTA